MSLINWIFDFYQHTRIDKAQEDAARARAEASAALRSSNGGVNVERLETAIGELALATKTVQRMMIDKGVCTSAEFADLLNRIDLEDGKADGKAPIR